MMIQTENETRLEYLAWVLVEFMEMNADHHSIEYDGTTCDGHCLAEDIQNEVGCLLDKPLRWTKTKPTAPGWYWFKEQYQPFGFMRTRIVKVREYRESMCIDNWEIPSNAEWAGPIPEPTDAG